MKKKETMNVILIMSDSFRHDFVGSAGYPCMKTPGLDRFAKKAMMFKNSFCGSFPTIPNRTDLHCGYWTFLRRPWQPLTSDDYTLAQHLAVNGYKTQMIFDASHLGRAGFHDRFHAWKWNRGQESDPVELLDPDRQYVLHPTKHIAYDANYNNWNRHIANCQFRRFEEEYLAPTTFIQAERWLEYNYDHDPFFLYIDTFDPHEPWDPPWWYVEMYDPNYDGEPVIYHPYYMFTDPLKESQVRHANARYRAEATMIDRWLGRFLQKAEDMGLFDNTIIVFLSDHGFLAGEHGRFGKSNRDWKKFVDQDPRYKASWPYFREVRGNVLLVHTPGMEGTQSEALVHAIDLFPTICDVVGIDKPDTLEGRSLAGLLAGETQTHRDIAVTTQALTDNLEDLSRNVTVSDGDWCLHYTGLENQTMLYDMKNDPGETTNVWSQHPDRAKALQQAFISEFEPLAADKSLFDTFRDMK